MSRHWFSSNLEIPPVNRWEFIRDVLAFQLKLGIDAIRDLVLVPISIFVAIADLVVGGERPGQYFYRVLELGRRSDIWINLFNAYPTANCSTESPDITVDALLGQLERLVVEQYERGGITRSAKEAIDHSLNSISRSRQS